MKQCYRTINWSHVQLSIPILNILICIQTFQKFIWKNSWILAQICFFKIAILFEQNSVSSHVFQISEYLQQKQLMSTNEFFKMAVMVAIFNFRSTRNEQIWKPCTVVLIWFVNWISFTCMTSSILQWNYIHIDIT